MALDVKFGQAFCRAVESFDITSAPETQPEPRNYKMLEGLEAWGSSASTDRDQLPAIDRQATGFVNPDGSVVAVVLNQDAMQSFGVSRSTRDSYAQGLRKVHLGFVLVSASCSTTKSRLPTLDAPENLSKESQHRVLHIPASAWARDSPLKYRQQEYICPLVFLLLSPVTS